MKGTWEETKVNGTSWRWAKLAGLYWIVFFVLLAFCPLSFTYFMHAWNHAAPAPTAERPSPLTNHGKTVYITVDQSRTYRRLMTVWMIGAPAWVVLGMILHHGLRCPVFADPTPSAMRSPGDRQEP
jgi:hypothetical protein